MNTVEQSAELQIERYKQSVVATFRLGGGSRPDVLLVQLPSGKLGVMKDFGACDPWFAKSIGRLLAWRECRALQRLHQVVGVPQLTQRLGPRAFLMEYAPAVPILKHRQECIASNQAMPDWEGFLARFESLIKIMHDNGVTHGDLRSPHNVLIDDSGNPWVVDFVSASFRARRWTLPLSWPLELVHHKLKQVDLSAVVKYRNRLLLADQADQAVQRNGDSDRQRRYLNESRTDRFWRQLGVSIRNLARRLLTRRD